MALSPGLARAALVYDTAIVSFNDSVSVTDKENGGSTADNNASLGTSELDQFDASLGVLTGVTINLASTRTQSVTVSVPAKSNKPPVSAQSTGTGGSTAGISAPGVSYTFTPEISASATCSGTSTDACSTTYSPAGDTTNQNLSASASSLDSYVGSGKVTVSRTAPTLYATQETNEFNGKSTTQYDLTWAGDVSATYTYLKHAAPSFDSGSSIDSLTLDFGSVEQNSTVSPLGFSIFNLADPDRTALDLIGFTATGDTSALDSNLAAFTNLSQGGDQLFYATLDTTASGSFSVTYQLTLSDAADTGAADSRYTYYMYLTLTGTVDSVSPVPVPGAFWLFGAGLVGIVGIARRDTPLAS